MKRTIRYLTKEEEGEKPLKSNQVTSRPVIPYVAKCGKAWQVAAIAICLVLVFCFFIARTSDGRLAVVQVWHQGGVVKQLGILLGLVCIPGIPLEVFRAVTVFDSTLIRHRSAVGGWCEHRYEDIVAMDVFPHEFVRITFRHGRTLKIWGMRADLTTVEQIIRPRLKVDGVQKAGRAAIC